MRTAMYPRQAAYEDKNPHTLCYAFFEQFAHGQTARPRVLDSSPGVNWSIIGAWPVRFVEVTQRDAGAEVGLESGDARVPLADFGRDAISRIRQSRAASASESVGDTVPPARGVRRAAISRIRARRAASAASAPPSGPGPPTSTRNRVTEVVAAAALLAAL